MTDDDIIANILKAEGWPVYANDDDDRGGPTKGGITLATLREWRGIPVTAEDVENLSLVEARQIYRHKYIELPGFTRIADDDLRAQAVDAGVMHGVDRATKWLQEIAGVAADGDFGPLSQAAVNAMPPKDLAILFAVRRIRFLGGIIGGNYTQRRFRATTQDQSKFADGWLQRATEFLLALVKKDAPHAA